METGSTDNSTMKDAKKEEQLEKEGVVRREATLCSKGQSRGEGNDTHSSTLAWKIPGTEGPGGLQSMGSLRVGHD